MVMGGGHGCHARIEHAHRRSGGSRRSNDAPGNKGAPDELVEAKERLNVASRTPPVGMVGACSEHSAHARRDARGARCSGA